MCAKHNTNMRRNNTGTKARICYVHSGSRWGWLTQHAEHGSGDGWRGTEALILISSQQHLRKPKERAGPLHNRLTAQKARLDTVRSSWNRTGTVHAGLCQSIPWGEEIEKE